MASGIDLGTAYIQIMPSADGITANIENVLNGQVDKAADNSGKKFGSGLLKTAGKTIAAGTAVVASATMAAGAALVSNAKDVAAYGDNVDKMSQKIGFTAEEYQKWGYVMERAGANVDTLQGSMKVLSTQAINNSEAFQQLGISQEELATMSQGELFSATIENLASMEEGAERTALASQLLGRSATELGPLLNSGTDAIRDQMDMAEQYGMVMSDEAVAASAAFTDSMTTMQYTLTGLQNSLISEFLPSMTQVTDGLSLIFSGDTEAGISAINEGVSGMIQSITDAMPGLMAIGSSIMSAIGQAIMQNLPQIMNTGAQIILDLANGLVQALPTMIPSIVQIVTQLVNVLMQNLPMLISAAIQIAVAIAQGILQGIPQLIAAVPQIFSSLVSAFTSVNWGSIGSNIVQGIASGVAGAAGALFNALKNLASSALEAAKGFLGIESPSTLFRDEVGKYISLGIGEGIEDYMPENILQNALGGLAGSGGALAPVTYGNITINAYQTPGQDMNEFTDVIMDKLVNVLMNGEAAYA